MAGLALSDTLCSAPRGGVRLVGTGPPAWSPGTEQNQPHDQRSEGTHENDAGAPPLLAMNLLSLPAGGRTLQVCTEFAEPDEVGHFVARERPRMRIGRRGAGLELSRGHVALHGALLYRHPWVISSGPGEW